MKENETQDPTKEQKDSTLFFRAKMKIRGEKKTKNQHLKNLPDEILSQPRWFEVGADKIPHVKDWSNPQNQKLPAQVAGIAGFDISGHDLAPDYAVVDFDHVPLSTHKPKNGTRHLPPLRLFMNCPSAVQACILFSNLRRINSPLSAMAKAVS